MSNLRDRFSSFPSSLKNVLDYILLDANGLALGLELHKRAPAMAVVITSGMEPT
jgi:hypothetical protein